jgi:transposase InsO family protein
MSESYLTPEQKIRQRFSWFQEAQRLGNVRLTCLRFAISRKTFYKWKKRWTQAQGEHSALLDRSRRPHHPKRHVKKGLQRRILALRKQTRLGPLRLRQLLLNQNLKKVPSTFTINKLLKHNGLTRPRKSRPKRYRRLFIVPRPGDLLQVDVKFVPYLIEARRLYQFTAIDCCTRLRIVQTDNDSIFTHWYTAGPKTPLDRPVKTHPFTAMCQRFGAQHRLIPPRTPRLNGKVEHSHQTDDEEFYRLKRYPSRQDLQRAFARWIWHYNHTRLHMGLKGKTPIQALRKFSDYANYKQLKCYPC